MKRIWFVYQDNYVRGPFSTEEIDNGLAKKQLDEKSIVWWRGQKSWITLKSWQSGLQEITRTIAQEDPLVWFAQANGTHKGPLTKTGLISMLNESPSVDRFKIWKDGLTEWKSVFEVSEIASELGLNPRNNPRVPFDGTVLIELPHQEIEAPISNLSAGGFAISHTPQMPANQMVRVTIRGNDLATPVKANAEVVYSATSGHAGFKFEKIHVEAQSTIVDYVRRTVNSRGEPIYEDKSLAILKGPPEAEITTPSEVTAIDQPEHFSLAPLEQTESSNFELLEPDKKAA